MEYPFLHFIREYLLRYPRQFLVNRAAHITLASLAVIPPYLLGVATDILVSETDAFDIFLIPTALLPTDPTEQFLLTVGLLAGVVAIASLANVVDLRTQGFLREQPEHDVRADAYDATQRLGLEFFDSAQTGDIMRVLNNDLRTYTGAYRSLFNSLMWWGVTTTVSLIIMVALHWQFTLILVLLLAPIGVISHAFDKRIAPQHAAALSEGGRLNARIQNSIAGIGTVKMTTNEDLERERVRDASRKHRNARWAIAKTRGLFGPFTTLSSQIAAVIAFVLGAWWAVFGPPLAVLAPLTIGAFVTFFYYMQSFTDSVARAIEYIDTYRNFRAAADRVHGLMACPASVQEAPDATPVDRLDGRVRYEDVTFRYAEGDDPALRDVSFGIGAGEYVGVVGPTGAGKTTLCKLLVRLYDADVGTIRVDGHDLRDLDLTSLRKRIGYVSQEPFLFDDTVAENIAYANPDASRKAIVRAAERANAHEFIRDLDDGYDTQVGERGVKLSGGQRQRIAIARAVLKDPDILILDEATSHVDNETELLIQEALDELVADRTTFAIAHSLATVRHADTLLVLEDGTIVEHGDHQELLAEDGLYATLWKVHVGEHDGLPERLLNEGGHV